MTLTTTILGGQAAKLLPRQSCPSLLVIISTCYPIFKSLISMLDTKSLLSLCRTCKEIRSRVQAGEWNINTRLMPFINNPHTFRGIIGASEALIYGDFATRFFYRILSKTLTITINTTKADRLQAYLRIQGYELVGHERVTLGTISSFRRGDFSIVLKKTKLIPIRAILSRTATTQAMNFITWKRAYSVFPKTTFIKQDVFPLEPTDRHVQAEIARCIELGWSFSVNASPTRN